jgi:L,D-transpeptidase YcbB
MKKKLFFTALISVAIIAGCRYANQSDQPGGTKRNVPAAPKVSLRNYSITPANAYNDIFLDSTETEKFIGSEKLGDTIAAAIRSFYNTRNYEYAWFASNGLGEQAMSFHSLYTAENDPLNRVLEKRLDNMQTGDDTVINPKDPMVVKTELQITRKLLEHISVADLSACIPAKKTAILNLADTFLADTHENKDNDAPYRSFYSLKDPLKRYRDIAVRGGWPTIDQKVKKIKPGASAPVIALIKRRLQITGELPANDTTAVYTPELENSIKTYQFNHGKKPTGLITNDLIADLNIPALTVVQQILVNMQRMRWMATRAEGRLIIVNIPEFELYVDSGRSTLFQMDVVVGAEGHNTTMFSGRISQIIFNPYWDVPPSIVKKEILPAIQRDPGYLEKKDMEIAGHEGGLPVVRQRPGEKNALGKVKFLFPNSFNIYLHDTPEKGLFSKSNRDKSHGCIRLADAPKMAHYLLQNDPAWPPEKIDEAMNNGQTQSVKLRQPVPVIITYYTTWVDDKGALRFADDIYGNDDKMALKMFTNPQRNEPAPGNYVESQKK